MPLVSEWLHGPVVGMSVGLTDVALVFPLAVIATRRENGLSLKQALKARNFHAGAPTAATLLLPVHQTHCVLVC